MVSLPISKWYFPSYISSSIQKLCVLVIFSCMFVALFLVGGVIENNENLATFCLILTIINIVYNSLIYSQLNHILLNCWLSNREIHIHVIKKLKKRASNSQIFSVFKSKTLLSYCLIVNLVSVRFFFLVTYRKQWID